MSAADLSIVVELETAINAGSAERCLEAIKRVTGLFLSSAGTFNSEQIELFDNVLERLIKTIEIRALTFSSARISIVLMRRSSTLSNSSICSLLNVPADDRKRPVTRLIASRHLSAEPAFIAVSSSTTIDKSAADIAHPERLERYSKRMTIFTGNT